MKHLVLLQGGLANQLLQSVLVAHCEDIHLSDLSFSETLIKSRLRILRSVTRRDLSPLFFKHSSRFSPLVLLLVRLLFRTGSYTNLYNGAISSVKFSGTTFYKGDGLTSELFTEPFSKYWFEILDILDGTYGLKPQQADVALHVRRGDYANKRTIINSGLYPLPTSYFTRAIELIKHSIPDLESVDIYSDSPKSVYDEFTEAKNLNYNIASGSSPEYDLWRLSHYPNLIISNSSFSSIAAHLAFLRNPSVCVVCPMNWFVGDSQLTRHDIRIPNWIKC